MKKKFLIFTSLLLPMTFLAGCGEDDVDPNRRLETTFKNYNQEVLYYNTVAYGGTATYQGPTPTRPSSGGTSYYFSGWDKPLENITRDTTFIAQYTTTPTIFQITWNNYDGTLLATTSVEYGKVPTYQGQTPTKPSTSEYNYTFTGWSPEVVEATSNTTYTAVFEEEEIIQPTNKVELSVVYSMYNPKTGEQIAMYQTPPSDLGYVSSTKQYDKGSDAYLYAYPDEGYTFVGWYYDGHLLSSLQDYLFRVWDKNEEIEARFKYTLYDFTVSSSNSNYGLVSIGGNYYTYSTTQQMFYTEEFDLYALATDTIRFIGWYSPINDLLSNNAIYTMRMPNYNYSVTSKWNKFSVSYELNGGHLDWSTTLIYNYSYPDDGIKYFDLPTPTKTGYVFQYWLVNGQSNTRLDESLLCDFNVEAVWSPITYTIKFDGNGSTSGSMSSMYMTYDISANLDSNEFAKDGYAFAGWNTEKDGSGYSYYDQQYVSNLTTTDEEVITLYAQWQANGYNAILYNVDPYEDPSLSYTVTFDSNGGTDVEPQIVNSKTNLVYPTIPVRAGYAFSGWYSNSGLTNLYDFTSEVSSNITLYAGWVSMKTSYYNRYNINPIEYSSQSDYFHTDYLSSSYYTYLYFNAFNSETIKFYYKNSSTSIMYEVFYHIYDATTDTELYSGSTTSTSYKNVSFDIIEGHVYYISLQKYSSSYSPEFYCYFDGYTAREDGGSYAYPILDHEVVSYGSNYYFQVPSSKAGCEFVGWFDEDDNQYTDEDGVGVDVWKSTEDTKLYPKWNYTEYTVEYVLDGGTNSKDNPTSFIAKDYITLEDPTKLGYTFEGWYLESTFDTKVTVLFGKEYLQNITLYAKWSVSKFNVTLIASEADSWDPVTVTFDSNGGSSVASQTIDYDTGLVYPDIPTKSGYVFSGWYVDQECTTPFDFSSQVLEDITVYAGWIEAVSSSNVFSVNASKYTSSSNAYSVSGLYTSSTYTYVYFTAFNSETAYFYYRTSSSSTNYRVYYMIYDVTANSQVTSGSTYSSVYSYNSLSLTKDHIYYIRLYKAYSSYYPTFSFYFNSMSPKAAGGHGPDSNIYKIEKVEYGYSGTLPHGFTRDGYKFVGWFDEHDNQFTDENGQLLVSWSMLQDVTLYAHWELIE